MMKRTLLTLFALCLMTGMYAQIADIWTTMPDTLCPYLSIQQRHYLTENAKVGLKDTVTNAMQGKSYVDSLNQDSKYIKVIITPSFTQELQLKGDTIVLTHTLCAPICCSYARYYTYAWTLLKTEFQPFDPALTDEQKKLFL